MATIINSTPWTSQPQQAVGIDWGNPLARGLVDWRSPTCGLSMVSTNGTIKTTRNGVAFSGNGAGVSGWYGVVNSGAINAANPATILALVIGASGNTDARAYSIAASTGYFFQIGSGATTSSKLRIVYRSPSKDLIGGETSSIVFENGVPHVAALRYTPGLLESFVDGKADLTLADTASGTTSGTLWASTNTLWRGSAATQNNTSVVLGLFWSRALSDAEIKSISQNPWQIFKPIPRRIFASAPTAGGLYTLTAQSGSYAISGQQATLLRHRSLSAQSGSYSMTGLSASISYVPVASVYTLTAQSGSYSLTGLPAQLSKHRNLIASSGSYVYTGFSAVISRTTLTPVYTLTALSGSYNIGGQTATILKHRTLSASTGAYVYTGQSISINKYTAGSNTLVKYLNVLTGEVLILKPI